MSNSLLVVHVHARANPLTDALAREGLGRSARSLRRAVFEGADVPRLVARAKAASSMKANPLVLMDEELSEIALRSR
jgi:alcohol dehydrogenase class IV